MVRGPCKGNQCDFWARAKLKKMSIDDIVQQLQEGLSECNPNNGKEFDEALDEFWTAFGIKDMEALRKEEIGLFSKIQKAEEQVRT